MDISFDGYRLKARGHSFIIDTEVPVTDVLDILEIPYTVNEVSGHIKPTGFEQFEEPSDIDFDDEELMHFVIEAMCLGLLKATASPPDVTYYEYVKD